MTNNELNPGVVDGKQSRKGDGWDASDLCDEIERSNTAMKAFGALLAGSDLEMFIGSTALNIEMREGLEQIIRQYLDHQGRILGNFVKKNRTTAQV